MKFFSPEDVQVIESHLRRQKKHLELMKEDKFRATRGIEFVGAFDFSEFYVLMHPDYLTSKYGEVVDSVINSTKDRCVLLPPWLWEFIEFMRKKALVMKTHFESESIRTFLSSIPQTVDVEEFQATYNKLGGMDYFMQLISENGLRCLIDEPINKLISLYKEEKIMGPEKIVKLEELKINPNVYSFVFNVLKGIRPGYGEELNNKFDAYAYALAYKLNEAHSDKYYFYVVTHSPSPFRAFKTMPWQEDPLHQGLSLVRHPVYQLQIARLDNKIPTVSDQVKFIKEGIELVDHLIDDIKEIQTLENMLRKTTDPTERARIRKKLLVRLDRFRKYDDTYWSEIFLPVQNDVKKTLESTCQKVHVREAYENFLKLGGFEVDALVSYERIRTKVKELCEETLEITKSFNPLKIDRRLKEALRWIQEGEQ